MSRLTHAEVLGACNALLGGPRGMLPLADFGYNRGLEDAIESLELLVGYLKILQSDRTEQPDLSPEGKALRKKWVIP